MIHTVLIMNIILIINPIIFINIYMAEFRRDLGPIDSRQRARTYRKLQEY